MIGDIKIDYLFTLRNVLYVPDFDLNLISVSALTKTHHLIVQFTCHHAYIQDIHHTRMTGKADNMQDLYVTSNPIKKELHNARINAILVDLWHKRS